MSLVALLWLLWWPQLIQIIILPGHFDFEEKQRLQGPDLVDKEGRAPCHVPKPTFLLDGTGQQHLPWF